MSATAGPREETLVFGDGLVGIVTRPAVADPARPAVIVLNAGLVHRVGPQRLHVVLLRQLAAAGFTGLRFDFSGIGDSPPRTDLMPYTQSTLRELRQAMDAMAERCGCQRFVIAGLSSGALVSIAAAGDDARVAGVCTLNPHGFGESSVWGAHVQALSSGRDYARNLLSLASWRKLLTGRTNYRRLLDAVRVRLAPRQHAGLDAVTTAARPVLSGFLARGLPTLMVFSAKDPSRDNMEQILGRGWQRRLSASVRVATIADANHTFANPRHLAQAVAAIEDWLLRTWPVPAPASHNAAAAARAGAANGEAHGL